MRYHSTVIVADCLTCRWNAVHVDADALVDEGQGPGQLPTLDGKKWGNGQAVRPRVIPSATSARHAMKRIVLVMLIISAAVAVCWYAFGTPSVVLDCSPTVVLDDFADDRAREALFQHLCASSEWYVTKRWIRDESGQTSTEQAIEASTGGLSHLIRVRFGTSIDHTRKRYCWPQLSHRAGEGNATRRPSPPSGYPDSTGNPRRGMVSRPGRPQVA
jgi:hypothetical protein